MRAVASLAFAGSCAMALTAAGAARAADVIVPGSTDFPESMTRPPTAALLHRFGKRSCLARETRRSSGERIHQKRLERLGFGARRSGRRQVEHALCMLGRLFRSRPKNSRRLRGDVAQTVRSPERRGQRQHSRAGADDLVQRHCRRQGRQCLRILIRSAAKSCSSSQGAKRIRGLGEQFAMEHPQQGRNLTASRLQQGGDLFESLRRRRPLSRHDEFRRQRGHDQPSCKPLAPSTIRTGCVRSALTSC